MSTYGSRDENRFRPPEKYQVNNSTVTSNINQIQYYLLVDSTGPNKGRITIKSPTIAGNVGGADLDRTIGTIPLDNKFSPSLGNATNDEIRYFSSAVGQLAVKNQGVITAGKAGLNPTLARQLIFPNTATSTQSQGDPQGGNPLPPSSQGGGASTPADESSVSEAPPPRDLPTPSQPINENLSIPEPINIVPRGSSIQYPRDMKPEQDKIRFTAVKIQRGNFGGSGLEFTFGDIKYNPVAGPIQLAIQAPISDQNSVDWGPDSVNAIDAALFKASLNLMTTPWENIPTELQSKANEVYNTAKSNSERIRRFLAGQAASINNVLSRTDGAVLNPNLELLFQGPQLRPFTFQFKMSARYKDEGDDIKKIIKYFKYFMAVRKEQNNLFLRAPYVFTIEYIHKNQNLHPGINIISPDNQTKACALTNCSVDYTPLGTYMTYDEGTMVSYTLSLQFQEITPIYDTDYKDKDYENHPIGF